MAWNIKREPIHQHGKQTGHIKVIKHKNTKHHPVLRPATAEKQPRQARHKKQHDQYTRKQRERGRERKTRAVSKHVCTHRTNLNIPSTLFFKNSSGYAKHTIKRGSYSFSTFIKHEKPAAKYIHTFFFFPFCGTRSCIGIKIKLWFAQC